MGHAYHYACLVSSGFVRGKIQVAVGGAAGVELRATSWALVGAGKVLVDVQHPAACAAKHRRFVEHFCRYHGGLVVGNGRMTLKAGEEPVTANKSNSDDIQLRTVVPTSGEFVDLYAEYVDAMKFTDHVLRYPSALCLSWFAQLTPADFGK